MQLHIKNFRSIENLSLQLAPITLLYGHNGTGKSSALYAPLTLKNIILNPEQPVRNFFQYGFANLGTFQDAIFDHDMNRALELGISLDTCDYPDVSDKVDYRISCSNGGSGSFQVTLNDATSPAIKLDVTFPYDGRLLSATGSSTGISWNGVYSKPDGNSPEEIPGVSSDKLRSLNLPPKILKKVDFVPLGRGFFQPSYTLQKVTPLATKENDMSSLIAKDRHLKHKITSSLERVLNRRFEVDNEIGEPKFYMTSVDKKSEVSASLVNDGFGVNQLVYMLAKVLRPDAGIVCIEEPEIHLHPTAIRLLARELNDIVNKESNKRLLISTHSEQFIRAFTTLVVEGKLSPDDLALYLVTKEGKTSKFTRNEVNEKGQIEGGLRSFIEGELEDLKVFLGLRGNAGNATREADATRDATHSNGDV